MLDPIESGVLGTKQREKNVRVIRTCRDQAQIIHYKKPAYVVMDEQFPTDFNV